MKKNIVISALSKDVGQIYIPYIYGALRSYCDSTPELKDALNWSTPVYDCSSYQQLLESIHNPDLLGLSCYVWNIQSQMWLAKEVKKKFPNCTIVAGGPSVPNHAENFLKMNRPVDYAVHGEGEQTFSEILKTIVNDSNNWKSIDGISYINENGTYTKTTPRKRLSSLHHLKNAYNYPALAQVVTKVRRDGHNVGAILETNRGCPYACVFCDWGSATQSKIKTFSHDKIFSEIDWFAQNNIDHVFCADANFGILPDDVHTVDYLISKKKEVDYPKLFTFNAAKKSTSRIYEISKKLATENMSLVGTTFSPQSLAESVLNLAGRKNIPTELFVKGITEHNDADLPVYSEILVGLPGETRSSFHAGITDLLKFGVHYNIRVYPLILLPNAPMSDPSYLSKHKIKTIKSKVWLDALPPEPEYEETVDLVISNSTMTPEDWTWMMTHGTMIQAFHCGGWTNYLSLYLNNKKFLDYSTFYQNLRDHLESESQSVMGQIFKEIETIFWQVAHKPLRNYFGWSSYQVEFNNKIETLKSFPYVRLWMRLVMNRKQILKELKQFLSSLNFENPELLNELLAFQNDLVLNHEHFPNRDQIFTSQYNFIDYFSGKDQHLIQGPFKNTLPRNQTNQLAPELSNYSSALDFLISATGGRNIIARQFTYNIRHATVEKHDKC